MDFCEAEMLKSIDVRVHEGVKMLSWINSGLQDMTGGNVFLVQHKPPLLITISSESPYHFVYLMQS